jgi:hypothetical protein
VGRGVRTSLRFPQTLPHGDAPLEKERADLVDRARSLADETRANTVQSLQVELLYRLYRDKAHCRSLHRRGDSFSIPAFRMPRRIKVS